MLRLQPVQMHAYSESRGQTVVRIKTVSSAAASLGRLQVLGTPVFVRGSMVPMGVVTQDLGGPHSAAGGGVGSPAIAH